MATALAALIDTDVFSALYVTPERVVEKQGHPVSVWKAALTGRRPVISFQTRAEVLSGAYRADWGEKRLQAVTAKLDSMPTIDEDRDVVDAYARLVADSHRVGHPFGQTSHHVGDRWIAACAIAKGLPLLTGNRKHFDGAPGLTLVESHLP